LDSAHLLVFGEQPETAEQINSLLRNSGIIIHVIFVNTPAKAAKALNEHTCCLVIIDAGAEQGPDLEKILQLAAEADLHVALRVSPQAPAALLGALDHDCCIAINRDDEKQLVKVVQKQLRSDRSNHGRDGSLEKLEELDRRYQLLLDSASDAVAYIHEGLHVFANKAYIQSMQVKDFSAISGLSVLELMQGEERDLKAIFREFSKGVLPESGVQVTVQNPAGAEFKAVLRFSATRFEGEDCIQLIMQPEDPSRVFKEELERLRHVDELTQLINRKTFTEHLAAHIEEHRDSELGSAVVYLEPDNISELQKDLGVSGMDSLIADLAQIVQRCIGPDDLAARFSEHGFAVLVRGSDDRRLQDSGDYIVQSFGNHIVDLGSSTISASCSAGMAILGALTHDLEEALSHARLAFAEAAQSGNCMVRYKPQLITVAPDEADQQWVERIRYALNNQDLYSIQQSIVNLDGDAEGLFENRTFMREEQGDRPPEEFLPAAEKYELASTIDRQVIPGLLKAISGTGDRHIINLSGNSILDFSFSSWFEHQMEEQDVQGSQIILQFTAEAAEQDLKATRRLIDELRSRGCDFSIANIDGRESGRRLIETLDVSMVKLKSGLAQGISGSPDQLENIKNVVYTANSADAVVVADEVQDAADLAVLWQCGVKLVAGEFLKESPQVVGQ
jgi:diguanylate cyclase (GGDEF)-like protein